MRLVIIKATLECSVENVCGSISKVNKQSIRKEWHVSGMPSYLSMGSALGSRQWAYTSGETGGRSTILPRKCRVKARHDPVKLETQGLQLL